LPERFQLVATRVVEPDPFTGNLGAIYLWVEELDENNVPNGRPRSYKLVYTEPLADTADEAQEMINGGEDVQGTMRREQAEDDPTLEGEAGNANQNPGGAYPEFQLNLAFDGLAPVILPDKGVL
jgi:hypothetical protein